MRKNQIINLLTLFVSAFLMLVISEGFLRLLHFPKAHKIIQSPDARFSTGFTKNGRFFWVNKINTDIRFIYDSNPRGYFDKNNTVYHLTNSRGYRSQEFGLTKEDNVCHIAFLGDSFTFGEGVKNQDTYSSQLIQLLNSSSSSKVSRVYKGLNFGVGGYNIKNSRDTLLRDVLQTKPDILMLVVTLNDAEQDLFAYQAISKRVIRNPMLLELKQAELRFAYESSPLSNLHLYQLASLLCERHIMNKTSVQHYLDLYKDNSLSWHDNKQALLDILNICKEGNIKCMVVLMPLLFQLDSNYPFKSIHQTVKMTVENAKSPMTIYYDLLPEFLDKKPQDLWVHYTDQHPNELAHKIIANALFKKLISLKIVE